MAELSNQNNNLIDLREFVKLFNDRFDKFDQNYRELAKASDDRFNKIDQNYRELVEFLGGQFDKMNAKIDTKADKADLDKKADKADIDRVLTRIAMTNSKIDDYRAE
ncbi:MAG: hypothetical protein WA093_04485, partial [Minisyncoccales bacterium]